MKLKYLTFAMTTSRKTGKSTYATWARFFDEEKDSRSNYVLEAVLTLFCRHICSQRLGGWAHPLCLSFGHPAHEGVEARPGPL